ncbi:F-box protein [Tetrabaena socialis]|uniref:F-box protein n=1 Tax=Tetrabaena socialis TaxID=47790 RepID=A0A2J8A2G8_9CHLO|nr:F-box protein [Tetrabaena socialis]|eukprot:PNH06710.1 F-box protein [Tetrabaena socialis]
MANVELTPQCWAHVFNQLPSRDVACAACVQRLWCELVRHDEHLWGRLMSEDLELDSKRGADGVQRPTFRSVRRRLSVWRQTVRGDGVIGKYPVLQAGGPEFSYCSCTHQAAARGSMEGEFRFVEGTMERPAGGAFEAACPRFSLEVPPYIY